MAAEQKKGSEARRTPRRVYFRPIGVLVHGKYGVQQALQLSEGGMLFQTRQNLEVGNLIVATLILPNGGCVVSRGEIIYLKPAQGSSFHQYGVKFPSLPIQLRRLIRNYVTAKTEEEAVKELGEDTGPEKRTA